MRTFPTLFGCVWLVGAVACGGGDDGTKGTTGSSAGTGGSAAGAAGAAGSGTSGAGGSKAAGGAGGAGGSGCFPDEKACEQDSDCCSEVCWSNGFCGKPCLDEGQSCSAQSKKCCSGTCNASGVCFTEVDCVSCGELLTNGGSSGLCSSNGSPSSSEIFKALLDCACSADSACKSACGAGFCMGKPQSSECSECLMETCGIEFTDCANDI